MSGSNVSQLTADLQQLVDRLEGLDADIITSELIDLLPLNQAIDQVGIELSSIEEKISQSGEDIEEEEEVDEDDEDEEDDA
jgi:hypothetical protein